MKHTLSKTLLLSLLTSLVFSACSSFQHISNGAAQFPEAKSAWKPEGIVVTPQQLREVQLGVSKQQLYKVLGVPHFNEGMGGNKYWDYLINVKDAQAPNAAPVVCQLKVQWNDAAQRLHSVIERLYWRNPAVCPPLPQPQVVVQEVVREVVKEVRVPVEVIREVRVPADAGAAKTAGPAMVSSEFSISIETLFTYNGSSMDDVLPESKTRLDALVAKLKAGGQLESVMITGHADRTGIEAGNQRLAQARADVIATYLMRTVGQPLKGASIGSRSAREALVSCSGLQGRALEGCLQPNRRVVIEAVTVKR